MSGAHQQQPSSLSIRDEFKDLIQAKWTRQVACQNECGSDESCSCQRKIMHVHGLEAWWNKRASEGPKYTKLESFVHEMPLLPYGSLPVRPTGIFTRRQSCLRILSLLLTQGRDHLIDVSHKCSESDKNLREKLAAVVDHNEVGTTITAFQEEKWEYSPLSLTLDMDIKLFGTKIIPPYCLKIGLLEKGGTASIYWVAVQKDLVSDEALALALQDSYYMDEQFGECYQMVLKSYCGDKRQCFENEKKAFSMLGTSDKVPILKCLGSYTHDYGDGKEREGTYNLLLEHGETDLYQAWADETNVPPVQAQEILRNWKSLFEVAEAIRHVHHLEPGIQGLHADIKPDNILSVRGRLKLADFGFSSFETGIEGHDRSETTTSIRGFTDTYGAPEVSRMKQPDGTSAGVSQSIDAWSFGCVLSVAATWTVLGFQGIRQYERLRQLSPTNSQNGLKLDRFHDGFQVLPEVVKWHNYLRGHLRHSDTSTELVLTLIEDNLLRAEPAARSNLEELCGKLQELSEFAERKIQSLENCSRDVDPVLMVAFSSIEEEAQIQRSSGSKLNLSQRSWYQLNPQALTSMPVNKEEMIRNQWFGQTTHRKQIMEEKLEDFYGKQVNNGSQTVQAVHNSAVTQSSTD